MSPAASARAAIERWPWLRAAVKSDLAQHLIQSARGARAVRPSRRFALRQLGPQRIAGYRLREGGGAVFLRHRTRDVNVLNEIFGGPRSRHCYEPPAAPAARLAASPGPRVVDLGANIGLFGAFALARWPGATVVSYEPDPRNLPLLERTVAAQGLNGHWRVERSAVSNQAGELAFSAGLFADSRLLTDGDGAGDGERIVVPTVDFLAAPPAVDLLKIDIEGGEWPILADPRFGRVEAGAIVLEWHAAGCPFPDPLAAVLRLLAAAGYESFEETSPGTESGMLWAWR